MNHILSAQAIDTPDWGHYYLPISQAPVADGALRVVLFGSAGAGMLSLEGLKTLKRRYGNERIQLVGLATDDARTDRARISLKKRLWRHYPQSMRVKMVDGIIQRAIDESMEVFTGNIKSAFFKRLLERWKPDVIVMACFGQIIPESVFRFPSRGMYNIHPSDLKNGIGIGARPMEDTIELKLPHTCVSVHEVTEKVDYGPLVGQSPPICIVNAQGAFPDDILYVEERVTSIFPHLAEALVEELMTETTWETDQLKIDFPSRIHADMHRQLLTSLTGVHGAYYPFPDPALFPLYHPLTQQP